MVGKVIDVIYLVAKICFVVNFYHFTENNLEKKIVKNSLFPWKCLPNFLLLYYPHGYYLWYIFSYEFDFFHHLFKKNTCLVVLHRFPLVCRFMDHFFHFFMFFHFSNFKRFDATLKFWRCISLFKNTKAWIGFQ